MHLLHFEEHNPSIMKLESWSCLKATTQRLSAAHTAGVQQGGAARIINSSAV